MGFAQNASVEFFFFSQIRMYDQYLTKPYHFVDIVQVFGSILPFCIRNIQSSPYMLYDRYEN